MKNKMVVKVWVSVSAFVRVLYEMFEIYRNAIGNCKVSEDNVNVVT